MDGRSRVFENMPVECLWLTVKYEEVYLHNSQIVREAYSGLKSYFQFYNTERLHSALRYLSPYEVYSKEHIDLKPLQNSYLMHLAIYCLDNGDRLKLMISKSLTVGNVR